MSNQRNDGSSLERIVADIERALLPAGFKLDLRRPVRDDDGLQIAELDIVIEGNVGSAPFKMLVECRDRPSEGPAPVSWIEQLVGRRQRFGFNCVIAVSSTGFGKPAESYGVDAGIELRTLSELAASDILSRLPEWHVTKFHPEIREVQIQFAPQLHPQALPPIGGRDPVLRTGRGELKSVQNYLDAILADPALTEGLPEDGSEVEVTLSVGMEDELCIETPGGVIMIRHIDFKLNLSKQVMPTELTASATYNVDGLKKRQIDYGKWKIVGLNIPHELIAIRH